MRLFLSHASEDKPFVEALRAGLPAHVRVWLDVDNLYAGHRLSDELRRAILDENDYVALFVSPRSLQSDWVARELDWALEREADLVRPFVVPVFLPGTSEVAPSEGPFAALWQRIYVRCPDDAAEGAEELARHLFALLSEWIETAGDSSRKRFIARLRADLTRFKDDAFLMIAAMGAPLEVLSTRAEAHAQFARTVGAYVQFSDAFIARKDALRAQIHSMFGGYLATECDKLLAFVEEKVFRGRLYELNAVVDAVNAYETSLKDDAAALAAAESDKDKRLAKAHAVLQQMTRRTLDLLAKLEQ
jgi:hypothetical protein